MTRDSDSAAIAEEPEIEAIDALEAEAQHEAKLWRERVDFGALLVALVLVPHSYPRNRFFSLFRLPEAQIARRLAARLRSVVDDLSGAAAELTLQREQRVVLSYRLDELGARRTVTLSEEEFALVKLALDRRTHRHSALTSEVDPRATQRVHALLRRLFVDPSDE